MLRVFAARFVRSLVRSLGYDIRRRGALGRTMADALSQLRACGFEPRTVIDIGIGNGTPDLYRAFPKARYLLVEPLPEFEPVLRRLATQLDAVIVNAAAGREAGMASISVEGEGSTIHGTPTSPTVMWVPVVTIDAACAQHRLAGPFLLKVDVQGGELEVLAGAHETLQETEAIVLEVSFFRPRQGWPQFAEVHDAMTEYGFALYDLFGGARRRDGALSHMDTVFVKDAGPFRRSHAVP